MSTSPVSASAVGENPCFRRLADYLAAKAPAGKLPGRQHIDPLEIPDLLSWIMLIDAFRTRLTGDAIGFALWVRKSSRFRAPMKPGSTWRMCLQAPRGPRSSINVTRSCAPGSRTIDGEHVDMLIAVFAKVEKPVKHAGEIASE